MSSNIDGISRIDIAGDQSIGFIGSLCSDLTASIVRGGSVELNIDENIEFDLTLIQLIESARQTAAELDCDFALASPAPRPVRAMLERGGFMPMGDVETRSFWLHEENK